MNVEWFDETMRRAIVRDNERANAFPDGLMLNPAFMPRYGTLSSRAQVPEWYGGGTSWTRYSVENDEVKAEHIDPLDWCSWQRVGNDRFERYEPAPGGSFELGNEHWWPPENERRFVVLKGRSVGQSFNMRKWITNYRDPQTCLTPVAVAVKIALDGSVN